jgi:catechol 2,3-dioxygenase-like lactoylglutathione lyase family enzyme
LDRAVGWFERSFGANRSGGGPLVKSYAVPSGGRNAYVRFGKVESEIIEPEDTTGLSAEVLTMHHVGYVVPDIGETVAVLTRRGFRFAADAPFTNVMGQQVLYFDADTTNGVMVHLTQLPAGQAGGNLNDAGQEQTVEIENIVHAGYLVQNLEEAIAWYVERLDGQHVGGGASRAGGRNAFVNFGQVQVELIEPGDKTRLSGPNHEMDHVGYVVGDMHVCMGQCQARGLHFVEGAPLTNSVQQQVAYFDTATSMNSRMHLTRLPD